MKTKDLKKILELVKPGLASREILEQATSLIFKDGHVWTFNDEVAVMAPLDIGVEGAVLAEPLYKLLAKLPADGDLDITTEGDELRIKCGKSRTGIRLEPEIRLPLDEELAEPEVWIELDEGFLPALKAVLFSASRSGHLPILTCVHITDSHMETCDEYRMTRCGGFQLEGDIKVVAKHLERLAAYKPIEDGISGNWWHFRSKEGVTYAVRMVEGEYPNLDGFLDVEGPEVEFPKELEKSLEWAAVMADDSTKFDQEVEVKLSKGMLTVRGEGPEGWAEDSLRMKYTGDPASFKAHPAFLKEMAARSRKVTVGAEALKVEGEGDFVHVVALDDGEE